MNEIASGKHALAVHVFEGERDRHRDNAYRALIAAKHRLDRLMNEIDTESPGLVAMHASKLVGEATEAAVEAAAWKAVADVSFMTDSDGREDPK